MEQNKNEQNKNEQNKNEQVKPIRPDKNAEKPKTKAEMVKERRLYLYTAISCAVALLAIVVIAIATAGEVKTGNNTENSASSSMIQGDNTPTDDTPTPSEPVVTVPEGMISPIANVSVGSDYGFYYNQTLNMYHEHAGVDFVAAVGTQVLAVEDGVVESVYKDDLLLGTEIVIRHDGGLRSVYRFVSEAEGLKAGETVKKGDVIATVADATGNEYKDGAHLHFEIQKDGICVDPTEYLSMNEK